MDNLRNNDFLEELELNPLKQVDDNFLTSNESLVVGKFYNATNAGVDYVKGFVSEVKKLNPNVNISAKWIEKNFNQEQLTIISSIPLEQLRLPEGFYGNALGRIIFPEFGDIFKENMNDNSLDFNISEENMIGFVNNLRLVNPNVEIAYDYDKEKSIGKIVTSVSLDKLNFPNGYYWC